MCVESEYEESDYPTHLLVDPLSFQDFQGVFKFLLAGSEPIFTVTYEHSCQQNCESNKQSYWNHQQHNLSVHTKPSAKTLLWLKEGNAVRKLDTTVHQKIIKGLR